jgi:dTDP-4-amino-4,6-dideoxygalactose transaminase
MSTETSGRWPCFSPDERAAADAVLASGRVNYWTGQEGRSFEAEYAQYLGVRHAIALANGSVALELPLKIWGIGPGDEVIVTPRSFVASASCVVLQGATPVFADVDRDSGNLNAEAIARVLTPRSRAIIAVHLGGWPCDMDPIMDLARSAGLMVLEDCAQAHGARYRDRPVGSIGHAAAFSFCQDKILTTGGEGGLLATNDASMWERAWSFKDHGKSWSAVFEREHAPGFRWLHEHFGTNWRMTETQAAIGRVQLAKLPEWVDKRRRNARILADRLSSIPSVRVPLVPPQFHHAHYRFYAYVRPDALRSGWSRDAIMASIAAAGVPCLVGSCPEIYLEKSYQAAGFGPRQRLAIARELGETSLCFLVHPTLSEADMDRAADVVCKVLNSATA